MRRIELTEREHRELSDVLAYLLGGKFLDAYCRRTYTLLDLYAIRHKLEEVQRERPALRPALPDDPGG